LINFNKPYITLSEKRYIDIVLDNKSISGNGFYTKECQQYFEQNCSFKKALLTTSCTDALEMCAMLADIKAGDEVIMPSFTFVSTALAFVRQGAKIVFADSRIDHPGIDEQSIESLITAKTKAIVVVHYAGVACDMDKIMAIAGKHNLIVIEDAAQAIDAYYKGKPLGSIGQLAAFSFHETKNITCGEGGLLAINDEKFVKRSEIIWEKGTNRSEFFRGAVNKYGWVDIGSSFLPSDILAAFLFAQLEHLEEIQTKRKWIWQQYFDRLVGLEKKHGIQLPAIPDYATNNGHMFYLVCKDLKQRSGLIEHLKASGIHAVFHYQSLHKSDYYLDKHDGRNLPNSDRYTDCLVRIPFYFELTEVDISFICQTISEFVESINLKEPQEKQ